MALSSSRKILQKEQGGQFKFEHEQVKVNHQLWQPIPPPLKIEVVQIVKSSNPFQP